MEFINRLLEGLEEGIEQLLRFLRTIFQWSLWQIADVPWDHLRYLPVWKIVFLSVVGVLLVLILHRVGREFFEAGEKATAAIIILLSVFIRTIPAVLLAGVVAAVGAWIVNNVNF